MEISDNGNRFIAGEGKVLRRMSDGWKAGTEIYLGYTYYLNSRKLVVSILELPEHYEEIDMPVDYLSNS